MCHTGDASVSLGLISAPNISAKDISPIKASGSRGPSGVTSIRRVLLVWTKISDVICDKNSHFFVFVSLTKVTSYVTDHVTSFCDRETEFDRSYLNLIATVKIISCDISNILGILKT